MGSNYKVNFKKTAEKELENLQFDVGSKIFLKIQELSNNPMPHGYKKLKGLLNTYRIRVGDYRVIYEVQNSELIIIIIKIGHRKDVYQ